MKEYSSFDIIYAFIARKVPFINSETTAECRRWYPLLIERGLIKVVEILSDKYGTTETIVSYWQRRRLSKALPYPK